MKITRVINNNVVAAVNEQNQELVLMGSGIGFQKKIGDEIDLAKVEKSLRVLTTNRSVIFRGWPKKFPMNICIWPMRLSLTLRSH